jgi:ribosome-binding factor A
MKPYSRAERVAGLLKDILADTLRKKVKDPRLAGVLITDVKMTRDLKIAKVYFVASGNNVCKEKATEGIRRAGGFFKKSLSREMDLRYIPELNFFYDESFDYGSRIEALLKSIHSDDGSSCTPIKKQ